MQPQKASKFITRPALRAKALSLEQAASTPRRNAKMQSLGATCSFEKASVSRQNSIQCSRAMRPLAPSPPSTQTEECIASSESHSFNRSSIAARPVSPLVATREANNLGIEGAIAHKGRRPCACLLARREFDKGSRGRGSFVDTNLSWREPDKRSECDASVLRRVIWLKWLR